MTDEPGDRCPSCGGTEGYMYSVRCYEMWGGDWGKEPDIVDVATAGQRRRLPATVTCCDCKERVPNPEPAVAARQGVMLGRTDEQE